MLKSIFVGAVVATLFVPCNTSSTFAATKKETAKRPPSAAQIAVRERQKKCGEEWRAAKVAGKIEKGMKWPQYWSACNKRLKRQGT